MPRAEVILSREDDRSIPLVDWLDELPKRAQAKCVAAPTNHTFKPQDI